MVPMPMKSGLDWFCDINTKFTWNAPMARSYVLVGRFGGYFNGEQSGALFLRIVEKDN